MTTLVHLAQPLGRRLAAGERALPGQVAVPVALFGLALGIGLWVASQITFPVNEGSAYYVAVARSLVEGRGLVVDALWSYTVEPLVLPRPAFELWQPLASIVIALPMALFGTTFAAAQTGTVVAGALLAPLAWLITRETSRALGADAARVGSLALGTGAVGRRLRPILAARWRWAASASGAEPSWARSPRSRSPSTARRTTHLPSSRHRSANRQGWPMSCTTGRRRR